MDAAEACLEAGVAEKLRSKSWKDRQEAYGVLRSLWSDGRAVDSGVIRQLQNEGNIPALEAAIDALLNVNGLRVGDVKKIFLNIGNSKTSIRSRIEALIDKLEDTEELVETLCELLGSKSPKNVAGALSAISEVVRKRGCGLQGVGSKIADVMGHPDKGVRSEGVRLCVELYKRHKEAVLPYLEGLKAIQQKELMEEFGKCSPVAEDRGVGEAVPIAVDLLRDAEDDNWKVRLEAMGRIKKMGKGVECNGELNGMLCRRIGDVNSQVFYATLEALSELKLKSPDVVRGLIERLKEKKGGTAERIKETLSSLGVRVEGSNVEFLGHKNPQVRLNLLDYSVRDLQKDKGFIKMVGRCVLDPVGEVRSKALEVAVEICRRYGNVFDGVMESSALSRIVKATGTAKKKDAMPPRPSDGRDKAEAEKKVRESEPRDLKEDRSFEEGKRDSKRHGEEHTKKEVEAAKESAIGSKRKHSQASIDVLLKGVSKQRIKGSGSREGVFTPQFIQMMDSGPFHQAYDLFDSIDKVAVSDFLIDFLVRSEASEAFINSTLLSFISSKYILKEFECRRLVEYLLANGMAEELGMMDRVYPVTKLFLVYQKIGTKESNDEILKLVRKYRMFRGDKRQFIEGVKKSGKASVEEVIRGCPDFLSFVDELEGSFMSVARDCDDAETQQPVESCSGSLGAKKLGEADGAVETREVDMELPSVHSDSFVVGDVDIEASFDALSIHSVSGVATPNSKKLRGMGPPTPRRQASGLELVLDHLIDSNPDVSEVAFRRLMVIIDTELESLLSFSNSIVSSILIQLFDVLHNPGFSGLIFQTFLKLSQSRPFCEQLRRETLLSANVDLIKIMKRQNVKERCKSTRIPLPSASAQETSAVGEILINLCLNCKPSLILEVYLEMLTSSREEILLKLIWRHSKGLRMDDREELSEVLDALMRFYDGNYTSVLSEDNVTLKILQLHLKEMVKFYREDIYGFGVRGLAKVFVGSMLGGGDGMQAREDSRLGSS